MDQPKLDRFLSLIEMLPTGCWRWIGNKTANGYGRFYFRGVEERAHRVSYRYFIGDLPAYTYRDGELDHLCRNRACVNPTHLELVTHQTNIRRGTVGGHRGDAAYRRVAEAMRGRVSPMLGRTHTPETIAKMSAKRRAYWQRKREAA